MFTVYPAIDILGGKCVRLIQGDYNAVTIYSDDPLEIAKSFEAAGASCIHIVDLDAARTGHLVNFEVVASIAERTGLYVQAGGGIRNMETLDRVLSARIYRAILGTGAVKDRFFTESALRRYGGRIAIGIDSKDGVVSVEGWTATGGVKTLDFARDMEQIGASTVIYTDISRDGMLSGAQLSGIRELVDGTRLNVIASGGIGSLEDIIDTREAGACGVIVGKALYEGKVDLKECLLSV